MKQKSTATTTSNSPFEIGEDIAILAKNINNSLHDFNNNLFLISAQTQLLMESISDRRIQNDLKLITLKIQQAAQLLKDIHLISRKYKHSGGAATGKGDTARGKREGIVARRKAMIITSDIPLVERLTELLEQEGFLVWSERSFEEVVNTFECEEIPLVIIDGDVFGMNIPRLLTYFSRHVNGNGLKAVILSPGTGVPAENYPPWVNIISRSADIREFRKVFSEEGGASQGVRRSF